MIRGYHVTLSLDILLIGEHVFALREWLGEALEMNRREALESAASDYTEEPIAL